MNITILNGNPRADNASFDSYLKSLADLLESGKHKVTITPLRDMEIAEKSLFKQWFIIPARPDILKSILFTFSGHNYLVFQGSLALLTPFLAI